METNYIKDFVLNLTMITRLELPKVYWKLSLKDLYLEIQWGFEVKKIFHLFNISILKSYKNQWLVYWKSLTLCNQSLKDLSNKSDILLFLNISTIQKMNKKWSILDYWYTYTTKLIVVCSLILFFKLPI